MSQRLKKPRFLRRSHVLKNGTDENMNPDVLRVGKIIWVTL